MALNHFIVNELVLEFGDTAISGQAGNSSFTIKQFNDKSIARPKLTGYLEVSKLLYFIPLVLQKNDI